MRKSCVVAVLACAAVLLAGCGGRTSAGGGTQPPKPTESEIPGVTAIPRITDVEAVLLPVDAYLSTTPQVAQEQHAAFVLARRCLTRYGITLPPPPDTPYPDIGLYGMKRRYGVPDTLADARRYGFHMAFDDPRSPEASGPRWPGQIPAQQRELYTGLTPHGPLTSSNGIAVPKGGCLGEAYRALSRNDQINEAPIVDRVKRDSFGYSQLDPRVIAAQTGWSTCMAAEGYRYRTSLDAMGKAPNSNGPNAGSAEIGVAVADYDCATKVNLVGVWAAVETAYQNQQIDAHAEEFAAARTSLQEQQQATAAVLAGNE